MRRKLTIIIVALFMGCTVVSAQTGLRRDTVSVYFGSALSQVDSSFGGNAGVLDSLNALISRYSRRPGFSLSIKGTSSPDGTQKFNQWLSERRTENFAEYIKAFDDTVSIGVDWEGLERDILEYGPFPGSEQVLDIVRNTPLQIIEDGKIVGSRKKSLMDLRGGRVFNYMMEHIFPLSRRVDVIVTYTPPPVLPIVPVLFNPLRKEVCAFAAAPSLAERVARREPAAFEYEPYQRIALKTNLLADAALMPSLEAEYLINEHWSVAAHGAVAWLSKDAAHKYYQVSTIYPEARWWFRTRKPWHGHYLGLFAGGAWYDLENGGRGYQGEAGFVGLSYGYMFPITDCLSFEAGLGLGYMYTKYEEYEPVSYMEGTHYVYQQTSVLNYLGPLKVKFAFVWRLWDRNKKGGDR